MNGMNKVIVGLSGGVDSAVAAYLLKKDGYDVVGVTLRTWQSDDGSESLCCDIDDARSAAFAIGIDYYPVNCTSDFKRYVVDPFAEVYLRGMTPNPCIECNRYVKWDKLLFYAKISGAGFVATGHYASVVRLDNGRYTLKKARFAENDAGLPVASKPDSQEVCFVTDGSYADFIEKNMGSDGVPAGNFVDTDGNILGRHKGICHYTVGQRKGLGLALGYPAYVNEIRPDSNEVVVGDERFLFRSELLCTDTNFMSIPGLNAGEEISCTVKIRYRHGGEHAIISSGGGNTVKVVFEKPVRAPTPGQSAVFYDSEERIIGGGVIAEVR